EVLIVVDGRVAVDGDADRLRLAGRAREGQGAAGGHIVAAGRGRAVGGAVGDGEAALDGLGRGHREGQGRGAAGAVADRRTVDVQRLAVVVADRAGALGAGGAARGLICRLSLDGALPICEVLIVVDGRVAVDGDADRLRLAGRAREGQGAAGGHIVAAGRGG